MKLKNLLWATTLVIVPGLAAADTVLRIGLQQEPTSLDPTSDATASIDGMLTHNVFESLTTADESGAIHPRLAKSWTISEDGTTYIFELEQGVLFHDGTSFDAEDVVFSFNRAMAEESVNPSKSIFKPIDSVNAIASHKVEIKLSAPNAFFLFNISRGDASIVGVESVEENKTNPVGTGPFTFASWTRGDRLVLAKNAQHRDADNIQLDGVEFRFIADAAAATAALMAEEIDIFPGFPAPELMDQFEADPRFSTSVGSTQGEVVLALNNSKEPFSNLEVRKAITHSINRGDIIDGAMYGRAVPISSFYPPHGESHVDLSHVMPFDLAKATALFEDTGLAGSELSLRVPPFPYATRSGEIIQAQLAQAGVTVNLETVEWGFWIDEVFKQKNYDMTIIAHTSPNDLGNFARGPDYYYGYDSAEFNEIFAALSTETNVAMRHDLTVEAQTFLAENAPAVFLFQLPRLSVFRSGVEGFWQSASVLYQPLAGVTMKDASQ
ncbi:Dipeptide-binding ABC transporter, periplasmic substrate-binding component [Candidatus Rhodobacter oscarellae]|uniref:Dipeptide-binding ABC transporter, periplasmic substrate-binding component n=1 Tax=Candidatus Rhodobacter oscarellae TaxID=1675527 RepID=A0A0J9GY80_9RHOB|nr:ABC transporter substrate-binding protein [Candidatus Rhodobacter lobularis]KMW58428.1 Dipeptide-binding ABC transporter, periplasmic substrate-binding component [Candidatus Rhodobacter lobularis]